MIPNRQTTDWLFFLWLATVLMGLLLSVQLIRVNFLEGSHGVWVASVDGKLVAARPCVHWLSGLLVAIPVGLQPLVYRSRLNDRGAAALIAATLLVGGTALMVYVVDEIGPVNHQHVESLRRAVRVDQTLQPFVLFILGSTAVSLGLMARKTPIAFTISIGGMILLVALACVTMAVLSATWV